MSVSLYFYTVLQISFQPAHTSLLARFHLYRISVVSFNEIDEKIMVVIPKLIWKRKTPHYERKRQVYAHTKDLNKPKINMLPKLIIGILDNNTIQL